MSTMFDFAPLVSALLVFLLVGWRVNRPNPYSRWEETIRPRRIEDYPASGRGLLPK
jgi:hypothetical protein